MKKTKQSRFSFHPFNVIEKQPVPKSRVDSVEGITEWTVTTVGNKNDFPQQLLQNVANSPAGAAALDIWAEFTEGGGFTNPIGNIQVNKKDTLKILHGKLSTDFTTMNGIACIVAYDRGFNKKSVTHLPFENCRLGDLTDGKTSRIYYNPYYGSPDFDKKYTKWYYDYNPDPNVIRSQVKEHKRLKAEKKVDWDYPGQVYWAAVEKPLARVYPKPFYFSAIHWFKLDADIQKFHSRNIDNNLWQSILFRKFGNPDEPTGEPDNDGNYTSTAGEDFAAQMTAFTGAEDAGGAFVDWFMNKDEQSSIEPFPTNANDTLFSTLQNIVSDQIAIGTRTPRILLGIGQSGKLGDTQEILNAVKTMQSKTDRGREWLSSHYQVIFSNFLPLSGQDFTIKNVNPIDILPQWVIDMMTDQEKRQYASESFNLDLQLAESRELLGSPEKGVEQNIQENGS